MRPERLPAHDYRRMRWKNDRGWTREILRMPEHAGDTDGYDWRVSIAEIDDDCAFSAFPGCDRALVLLRGQGMTLQLPGRDPVTLEPPHAQIRFRGEEAVTCRLLEGPTHDFNVIWRRDRMQAQVLHRPLVGPMVFLHEFGVHWLVHVLSGRAIVKDHPLPPLDAQDSLHLSPEDPGQRIILDGGGELLLARIAPVTD